MSPASFPVLGLAALAASPALYNGLVTKTLPMDQMLTRYLITVAVVWAALSVLAMMIGSPKPQPKSAVVQPPGEEVPPATANQA
jgi:hypothetical protein